MQAKPIAPSVAKRLIAGGWKLVISAQLTLELIEGEEQTTQFIARPGNGIVEAIVFIPSSSQVTDTDINSTIAFEAKRIRAYLGLVNNT